MTVSELILGLGLSDELLAVRLCVSARSVARWRKGHKLPTAMARKALAKLAGVPVCDLSLERKTATAIAGKGGT